MTVLIADELHPETGASSSHFNRRRPFQAVLGAPTCPVKQPVRHKQAGKSLLPGGILLHVFC